METYTIEQFRDAILEYGSQDDWLATAMSEYTDVVYKMEDCIKFTSEDCDARVMRGALDLLKKYHDALEAPLPDDVKRIIDISWETGHDEAAEMLERLARENRLIAQAGAEAVGIAQQRIEELTEALSSGEVEHHVKALEDAERRLWDDGHLLHVYSVRKAKKHIGLLARENIELAKEVIELQQRIEELEGQVLSARSRSEKYRLRSEEYKQRIEKQDQTMLAYEARIMRLDAALAEIEEMDQPTVLKIMDVARKARAGE